MLESINKIYLNLEDLFLHIDKDTDRYVNNEYIIKLSYLKSLININEKENF